MQSTRIYTQNKNTVTSHFPKSINSPNHRLKIKNVMSVFLWLTIVLIPSSNYASSTASWTGFGLASNEDAAIRLAKIDVARSMQREINQNFCTTELQVFHLCAFQHPIQSQFLAKPSISNNQKINQLWQSETTVSAANISKIPQQLYRQIEDQQTSTKTIETAADRIKGLQTLIILREEYNYWLALNKVAGDDNLGSFLSNQEVRSELKQLLPLTKSLPELFSELSNNLKTSLTSQSSSSLPKIKVLPPLPEFSSEVTPFSTWIKEAIKSRLDSLSKQVNERGYTIYARYTVDENEELFIEFFCLKDFEAFESYTAFRLAPEAYTGLNANPQQEAFDQLLHLGANAFQNANPEKFSSQLSTQKGSNHLVFYPKQTIRLIGELSQPGFFYLVGHINSGDKEYSYLMQFPNQKNPFIYEVPKGFEQTGIVLGDFTVEPPLGAEYLQMISSNLPLDNFLPNVVWDKELGYYLIKDSKGDIAKGLTEVRGLKPSCPNSGCNSGSGERYLSESIISFTTISPPTCDESRGLARNCVTANKAAVQDKCEQRGIGRNCNPQE